MPFRVNELTDRDAEELLELLELPAGDDHGARVAIGRWLSSHPEIVTVIEPADGPIPAVYRME